MIYELSCSLENKNCRPIFADILELHFLCDYDIVVMITRSPHFLELHPEIFVNVKV